MLVVFWFHLDTMLMQKMNMSNVTKYVDGINPKWYIIKGLTVSILFKERRILCIEHFVVLMMMNIKHLRQRQRS